MLLLTKWMLERSIAWWDENGCGGDFPWTQRGLCRGKIKLGIGLLETPWLLLIGGFWNLNYCWWIFTLLGMLRHKTSHKQTTIDIMNIIGKIFLIYYSCTVTMSVKKIMFRLHCKIGKNNISFPRICEWRNCSRYLHDFRKNILPIIINCLLSETGIIYKLQR